MPDMKKLMKEALTTLHEERHINGSSDLKPGERKVVVYSNGRRTIVVPDEAWDGIGDLSMLSQSDRDAIAHPSKYKINRRGTVIGPSDNNDLGVSGRKMLDELDEKGFAVLPSVEMSEERIVKLVGMCDPAITKTMLADDMKALDKPKCVQRFREKDEV